jgi:hypothetical protein
MALLTTAADAEPGTKEVARCAAFYFGLADFRALYPDITGPSEPMLELAEAFRAAALRLSPDPAETDAAIEADRPGMELLAWGWNSGGEVSTGVSQRLSYRCSEVGLLLPETRDLIRRPTP